jgi:hypothetical protein
MRGITNDGDVTALHLKVFDALRAELNAEYLAHEVKA